MPWTTFCTHTLLIHGKELHQGWLSGSGAKSGKVLKKYITYLENQLLSCDTPVQLWKLFFFFCQFPKCCKNKQWVNPIIVLQDFGLSWNQSCRPFISSFFFPAPTSDWCGLVSWLAIIHMCFSLAILTHNWWRVVFLFLKNR